MNMKQYEAHNLQKKNKKFKYFKEEEREWSGYVLVEERTKKRRHDKKILRVQKKKEKGKTMKLFYKIHTWSRSIKKSDLSLEKKNRNIC